MFDKILIANRGEIAVRIIRTCRKMGIRSVAVYSDADFRGLHVTRADEAVLLGGSRPLESYLAKEKITEAALQKGCQAVHPGYGFLSEIAEFADMAEKAGLTFIGPPARVIALLGDKIASKKIARSAGVPTVPGDPEPVSSAEAAADVAERIGFPVLLKPVAAGETLPLSQEEVGHRGWAIEARICAEDPSRGFAPSTGLITRYAEPEGDHVRVDSGIVAGSHVNMFYDPMLAKVIAWGEDREGARKRLVQALNGYHIEGVTTNVDFVNQILTHPAFIRGELSTDFIKDFLENEKNRLPPPEGHLHFMAVAVTLTYHLRENLVKNSLLPLRPRLSRSGTDCHRIHENGNPGGFACRRRGGFGQGKNRG